MTKSSYTAIQHWPRLRMLVPMARQDDAVVSALAMILDSDFEISREERRSAAGYLRRLAANPRALQLIADSGRGRPLSSERRDIALDYLVRKELIGKAEAARRAVATSWCVSPSTVKDCFGDWKQNAAARLSQLIDPLVGELRIRQRRKDGSTDERHWTRRELLEAVLDDLQDHRKAHRAAASRGRRKSP